MSDQPTYDDLRRRVDDLQSELARLKSAEQELSLFRRLADTAGYGFGMADIKGDITYANQALCRMLGEDQPDDAYGKNVTSYYPPDAREQLKNVVLPVVREKGEWVGDLPLVSIQGKVTPTIQNIFMIRSTDDTPPFIANLLIDISDRKRIDAALREALEFRERILAESPIGLSIYNEYGNCIVANQSLADVIGATVEQICQQNYNHIRSWQVSGILEEAKIAIREGKKRRCEIETKSSFGKDVYLECFFVPFKALERDHLLFMANDISEQRALRAQLQRAEKMEALGTLAGGVAHDLNNVLGGLVAGPDLLLSELPEGHPMRRIVAVIAESGHRATAIVQDLLTLARTGVSVMEVTDLNDVVRRYIKSPEHNALRRASPEAQVKVDLQDDLLKVMGSPVHLAKVVMNTVSNAIESLLHKSGHVHVSTRNQYIDRPVRGYDRVKEGDYVVLKIADDGVGIPEESQARIFEPFYTKKMMGRSGTGLGLAVVWGVVKDHKGYIDVQSEDGKGTVFEIYLPATRRAAESKPTTRMEEYLGQGENILVIDDVAEQREIANALLTRLGYTVSTVSSGEEAIAYLENKKVDLLVLDMIMDPGMDGLDTYREILKLHPKQQAVLVSGFAETERVKEAQRLGAGRYVRKPYTMVSIGLAVKEALLKGQSATGA